MYWCACPGSNHTVESFLRHHYVRSKGRYHTINIQGLPPTELGFFFLNVEDLNFLALMTSSVYLIERICVAFSVLRAAGERRISFLLLFVSLFDLLFHLS